MFIKSKDKIDFDVSSNKNMPSRHQNENIKKSEDKSLVKPPISEEAHNQQREGN